MNTDPTPPVECNLPSLSDEAAAMIQNFLEAAIDNFAQHYGRQIDRHYESMSEHNIARANPSPATDDPPF